jgi:hypothetical protein
MYQHLSWYRITLAACNCGYGKRRLRKKLSAWQGVGVCLVNHSWVEETESSTSSI